MIKFALEKVISEDMSDMWSILMPEEKRLVTDNFTIHSFKKNQFVYREGDEPEYLWTLLKGKIKKFKDGVGGRQQIIRLCALCSISAIVLILPALPMCQAHVLSSRR